MYKILAMLLLFALLGSKCNDDFPPDKDYPIVILNNSQYPIKFYIIVAEGYPEYPDTSIVSESVSMQEVSPGEKRYRGSGIEWKEVFNDLPSDTLSIFIFHSDTIGKYSWEDIHDEYKVLKRYDLSLQDLEKLEYYVYYPPSSEMEGMRMYPR